MFRLYAVAVKKFPRRHALSWKVYKRRERKVPLILNLRTGWKWIVRFFKVWPRKIFRYYPLDTWPAEPESRTVRGDAEKDPHVRNGTVIFAVKEKPTYRTRCHKAAKKLPYILQKRKHRRMVERAGSYRRSYNAVDFYWWCTLFESSSAYRGS